MATIAEQIVTQPKELEACCQYLSTCQRLGLDTEFVGEDSYHPHLCLVQVATEAKTAVLLRAKVKSWTGRSGATGTGTDAVVVVSGSGPPMRYSGTHTILGELVGRVIGTAVTEGLARYVRWHARRKPYSRVKNL